jgi:hypothetical protein
MTNPKDKRSVHAFESWSEHYKRSVKFEMWVRPHEYADLVELAKHWDCSVSLTAWALISMQLAQYRKEVPNLGNLIEKASRAILASQRKAIPVLDMRRTLVDDGEELEIEDTPEE